MACRRHAAREMFGVVLSRAVSPRALRILGLASLLSGLVVLFPRQAVWAEAEPGAKSAHCPAEMVRVEQFCIDRYEMATVDHQTGELLSPFYPPKVSLVERVLLSWNLERRSFGRLRARSVPLPELPRVQQTRRDYTPRAVSRPGIVPQGYLSQTLARLACENAGKRLCTEDEWITACRGEQRRKFPYGDEYEEGRCNVYVRLHPAFALHGSASYGHRDPRLNLVENSEGRALLRPTGATPQCASRWNGDRIYDLVGNIDEWVDAEKAQFLGGFYARGTREGCEAHVRSHVAAYYDYSTGGRCCRTLKEGNGAAGKLR